MAKANSPPKFARFLPALPGLLVLLAYLPTLNAQFVWDDLIFLSDNALYRDPALWQEALSRPFIASPNYFRPLAVLTFMGELRLWNLSPSWFHLTNLLLHAINTTLVTLLARELLRPPLTAGERDARQLAPSPASTSTPLAVAVGLAYGLHPALVEAVAFVSGRFDLLVTVFLLLALFAHARWAGRKLLRPLGVGIAFLAAAFTKEMAVVFPAVLLLWELALLMPGASDSPREAGITGGRVWPKVLAQALKRNLGVYVAPLATGLGYLGIRYFLLGYLYRPGAGRPIPAGDPLQHVLLVSRSFAEYVLLIAWPFTSLAPLHHTTLPLPLDAPAGWVALAASMVLLTGVGWLLWKYPKLGALPAAAVLSLLPVVNLLPLELGGGAFIAERFLTFPLALIALGTAVLLARRGGRSARVILMVWLLPSAATVELTLPHWRDNLSLWTWAAQRAPESSLPHTNLAQHSLDGGNYPKALEESGQALERDSSDAYAWNVRGVASYFLGRYPDARSAFTKAIELQPKNALFWSNLAAILRDEKKFAESEQILLEKALQLDVSLGAAYLNLGILYLEVDRPDAAIAPLERAMELLPPGRKRDAQTFLAQTRGPERWLRLGLQRLKQRDFGEALKAYDQAAQLGGPPVVVAVGKGAVYIEMKAWLEAKAVLEAALEKAPDDAYLNNNLGVVAQAQGDLRAARHYYARAAALAPNWDLPRANLARISRK